jgi:hypothetical protein
MISNRYFRHLLLIGMGVIFWPSIAAHSAIVLTVKQDVNDVVVIGSGSANTTSLLNPPGSPEPRYDYENVFFYNQILVGVDRIFDINSQPVNVNLWSGITGPSSFGIDTFLSANPSSATGDLFGIVSDNGLGQSLIVLPINYVSGDSLDGTSRFSNFTLADFGLSPGVFSWNWGMGQNADSFELRIEPVPVPAPLPLAGVPIAWKLAKRMRRISRDSPAKANS